MDKVKLDVAMDRDREKEQLEEPDVTAELCELDVAMDMDRDKEEEEELDNSDGEIDSDKKKPTKQEKELDATAELGEEELDNSAEVHLSWSWTTSPGSWRWLLKVTPMYTMTAPKAGRAAKGGMTLKSAVARRGLSGREKS